MSQRAKEKEERGESETVPIVPPPFFSFEFERKRFWLVFKTKNSLPSPMFIILILLFLPRLSLARVNSDTELERKRSKEEYESVEEVRGHFNETTTESTEDSSELKEAVLDVAYYLRRFKFSGYDPRYMARNDTPQRNMFAEFPIPPLRTIHWEVKKNCEPSFGECVKYLQEQVSQTVLPRHLDSLTIAKQNKWSLERDSALINPANDECLKLLESDDKTFVVFSGPLQRFQWLTSASYFMCYYTMKEVSLLKYFAEDCDNFASCIDYSVGMKNGDYRSDNSNVFACAAYSFCPDPCCPLSYTVTPESCLSSSPCALHSPKNQSCTFSRADNVNFDSIVLNEWNISCNCDTSGTRWESKSGMCVDIDECKELEITCDPYKEICKNLPNGFTCSCNPLGYRKVPNTNFCEEDPIMNQILAPPTLSSNETSSSYMGKFREFLNKIRSFSPEDVLKNVTLHHGKTHRYLNTTDPTLFNDSSFF